MNGKYFAIGLVAIAAALNVSAASARDEVKNLAIADALATADARAMLNKGIKFYFGDAGHPTVARSAGVFTSSKKANGFGKGDKIACERAFLSALLSFQDRALEEGGDAVVKITSYYRRNSFSSRTEYQCGTGALMVGVAFQGEVVTLNK